MSLRDVLSDIGKVLVGGLPAILDDPTASASETTGARKTEQVVTSPNTSASIGLSLDPKILIYAGVAIGAILIVIFALKR